MSINLDSQQQAAVYTESKRALVLSGAGSGKTRVVVERIADLIENKKVSPYEILSISFSRKAASELRTRIEERIGKQASHVTIGTIHAVALSYLQRFGELIGLHPGSITVYSEWEEAFLLKECALDLGIFNGKSWKIPKREIDAVFQAYYQKGTTPSELHPAHGLFQSFLSRTAENNSLTYGMILVRFWELIPKIARYLNFKHVFVDEIQDVDTCHPSGTLVRRVVEQPNGAGGFHRSFEDIPIEMLQDGDRVISWERRHAKLRKRGRKVTIGKRWYCGDLLKISCGDRSVTVTPDHKFYAMMNGGGEDRHAVYLMWRKDYGFRVGRCAIRYCRDTKHKPMNGVGTRFKEEGAEKGWILRIEKTKDDSAIWEQVISCNYGMPMVVYEESTHTSLKTIKGIFEKTSGDGFRCLKDHGLSFDQPLFVRDEVNGKKAPSKRYFETCACNLIPQLMSIPDLEPFTQVKIDKIEHIPYEGFVYSLNVEKDHAYIADGLIVKNCQWNILEGLIDQRDASLFVVGDSDQSIYSFRGAVPEYLIEHQNEFDLFKLESNYRSDPEIVECANRLIEHNTKRLPLTMKAMRENGISVAVDTEGNTDSAALAFVVHTETKTGTKPGDIAVLGRMHFLLDKLSRELDALGVPHEKIGSKTELVNSEAFRRYHSFLKLIVNPFDNFSFMLIRELVGVTREEYNQIRLRAAQESKSHFQAWMGRVMATVWTKLYEYFQYWEVSALRDDAQGVTPFTLGQIFIHLGLTLKTNGATEGFEATQRFVQDWLNQQPTGDGSISEYLDWLATYDIQDELSAEPSDKVQLLTIHAAKGLEFPMVIIAGCNDGILPSKRAIDAEEVQEERRLMYVAMTRARDRLVLTVRPEDEKSPRSRFLKELTEETAAEKQRWHDDGMPTEEEILVLQKEGHTFHCAMRILTGDGECECGKQNCIPGGFSAMMYAGRCPVCLKPEEQGHEEWCRNRS